MRTEPNNAFNIVNFILSENFTACHLIDLYQTSNISNIYPHYVIQNKGDSPFSIKLDNNLKIEIPPKSSLDLTTYPKFKGKTISYLKQFVSEWKELKIALDCGFVSVNENIFQPIVYQMNFCLTVYEWNNGDPQRIYTQIDVDAEVVSQIAVRKYMNLGKDIRCISCLGFPNGNKKFFAEKYPEELQIYKNKGIAGYEDFKYEYLQELENLFNLMLNEEREVDEKKRDSRKNY